MKIIFFLILLSFLPPFIKTFDLVRCPLLEFSHYETEFNYSLSSLPGLSLLGVDCYAIGIPAYIDIPSHTNIGRFIVNCGMDTLDSYEYFYTPPNDVLPYQNGTGFGTNVKLTDNYIYVSAPFYGLTGAMFAYTCNQNYSFCRASTILPNTPVNGSAYAFFFSALGGCVAVGAPSNNNQSGTVYFFCKTGSNWLQLQEIDNPIPANTTSFGGGISLNLYCMFIENLDAITFDSYFHVYCLDDDDVWQFSTTIAPVNNSGLYGNSFSSYNRCFFVADEGRRNVYIYCNNATNIEDMGNTTLGSWEIVQTITCPFAFSNPSCTGFGFVIRYDDNCLFISGTHNVTFLFCRLYENASFGFYETFLSQDPDPHVRALTGPIAISTRCVGFKNNATKFEFYCQNNCHDFCVPKACDPFAKFSGICFDTCDDCNKCTSDSCVVGDDGNCTCQHATIIPYPPGCAPITPPAPTPCTQYQNCTVDPNIAGNCLGFVEPCNRCLESFCIYCENSTTHTFQCVPIDLPIIPPPQGCSLPTPAPTPRPTPRPTPTPAPLPTPRPTRRPTPPSPVSNVDSGKTEILNWTIPLVAVMIILAFVCVFFLCPWCCIPLMVDRKRKRKSTKEKVETEKK
jgi:hypothetical protein